MWAAPPGQDCRFGEEQRSRPARLLVVRCGRASGGAGDVRFGGTQGKHGDPRARGPRARRSVAQLRNYAKVTAHDLREPHMAAALFVQQLDRGLSDGRTAENEELLERVHQTHARARSLVDGILELVRSEHLGGARGNARFGEVVAVWAAGTFGVKDSH